MPKKPTYEELEQRVIELESAASEWKRAFDDLRRSRLLLQSSIESPKDVIILSLDSEYCYLYFNEAHSQIMRHVYGSKPKIGDCIFDHMKGSADIETVKQHYDRALSGEGHVAINQYGDGQLRYFYEVRYNPIYDESDKILGVSAFAQNITERKQAEEELSQIFSMSLDLICIADINTATFMKVNPSFTEILGHSEKELLERPFMDFVHPDDMDATRAVIEQKLKSGAKVIDFENRYRCKDGSYRWLSWVSHPIPEQGVTYAVGRDVTESKLQVAELNKNKALLDATGRMAKVGGWELDADSLTVTWTDETYRIHELPLGEKPSLQDAIHFFHPEDRPKLEQSIQNALDRGAPYDMELRFITAKGNHLWTRTICEPEVVDGKVVRLKGTFHDITDRKHAERMLKNSEERYRRLTENSPDIVYRMSLPDGKYEYISPAVSTVFGYPPETWYENPAFIRDIIHPDWRSYLEKQWELLRNGQVPKTYEYQIVHKNGDIRWMNQRNVPVKDNNGRLIAIEAIITDITEQKRADEVIRESEERYRLIAEKTMDIIWTMNLNLDFTYVNPAIKTTFGYTATEWIGSNLQDHCDKYNFEMMAQIIVEELEKGTDHSGVIFEATMLKKNGDAIPVEIHGQILFDESGKPFSLQGITRDITERREAEAALRTSEKRLRAALDASPFPIVLVDANDDIVHYWSRSAQDLFGHTAPTAAEWYELAYPDPDYRAQVIERWKPCLDIARESGQPVNTGEYRVTCKDGTVRLCEIYATFITEGLVVSFNDITETRMSQEKEATLQAQLNQAQKIESIGRLAGGVAHDFNNMLSVILGHAEMALDQIEESSPLSNDLIEIQSAAKRSAELTRQLLAFARRQTISPKNLDLNATVESMLRMLGRLIGEDIDLSWLPGKNLHTVKMDPTQLDQLLANLCVNARDAIEGVGKVTIETCNVSFDQNYCNDHLGFKPGEYVCLSVSDNGCGMDKDTCANVFEPFFTTKKTGEGTGLGLATVYGIVKQNYGFINVYSEPGEGTTFRIYLPRHDSLAQNIDGSKKDVIKEGSGETILLVEDEAAIMRMGKAMLEKLGYKVLPSDNPMDALTIAQEYPGEIHALITDVVMPEMNGRNLAKRLQSSNPALKVLYMSGYTANVIAHHGTLDDGVHFLQKPFSKAQIASAIKRVLEPENE